MFKNNKHRQCLLLKGYKKISFYKGETSVQNQEIYKINPNHFNIVLTIISYQIKFSIIVLIKRLIDCDS